MQTKVNKNLYVFLCAILGVLLFFILQRTIIMVCAIFLSSDLSPFSFGLTYSQLVSLDFYSLFAAAILGIWYGVWLGDYWYRLVYEEGRYLGVIHHVMQSFGGTHERQLKNIQQDVHTIQKKVAEEVWELEELSQQIQSIMPTKPAPKRKVAARRTVKK